jgi:hypothetical protein
MANLEAAAALGGQQQGQAGAGESSQGGKRHEAIKAFYLWTVRIRKVK